MHLFQINYDSAIKFGMIYVPSLTTYILLDDTISHFIEVFIKPLITPNNPQRCNIQQKSIRLCNQYPGIYVRPWLWAVQVQDVLTMQVWSDH